MGGVVVKVYLLAVYCRARRACDFNKTTLLISMPDMSGIVTFPGLVMATLLAAFVEYVKSSIARAI